MKNTMTKRNGRLGLAALLLAGVCLGLCGCGNGQNADEDRGTAVEVATAAYGTIVDATVVRGNVVAAEDVYVVPKAQGVVRSVNVSVGDYVNNGQTLCQIDTVDLQTSLALVQSQYNTLNSAHKDATKNLERMQALYKEGAISLSQLEQAQSAVNQVGLESARLQVQNIQDQINNCNVKSTISGIVAEVNINPGDMAGSSYVARVVDIDEVKLTANVTENLVSCMKLGQEVPVHIEAASAEPFIGTVTAVPVAANQTMTYPVEITIENPEHIIMAGMFAEVDVVRNEASDSLIIPKSAVNSSGVVYVVEGDFARAVNVETGMSDDNNIEIVSGIKAGDVVVTAGAYLLEDGSKVRVVEGTPSADAPEDTPASAPENETTPDADAIGTDGADPNGTEDKAEGNTDSTDNTPKAAADGAADDVKDTPENKAK